MIVFVVSILIDKVTARERNNGGRVLPLLPSGGGQEVHIVVNPAAFKLQIK
jgi:hypothetical protein